MCLDLEQYLRTVQSKHIIKISIKYGTSGTSPTHLKKNNNTSSKPLLLRGNDLKLFW